MFCKNCGAKVSDSAKFCVHCGTPTDEITQNNNDASNQGIDLDVLKQDLGYSAPAQVLNSQDILYEFSLASSFNSMLGLLIIQFVYLFVGTTETLFVALFGGIQFVKSLPFSYIFEFVVVIGFVFVTITHKRLQNKADPKTITGLATVSLILVSLLLGASFISTIITNNFSVDLISIRFMSVPFILLGLHLALTLPVIINLSKVINLGHKATKK